MGWNSLPFVVIIISLVEMLDLLVDWSLISLSVFLLDRDLIGAPYCHRLNDQIGRLS